MLKITDYMKTGLFILFFIWTAPTIIGHIQQQWTYNLESHNKIGYIAINGNISNSSVYRKNLINFFKDNSIKGVFLKIESQGGVAGSCQALAFDIENLKKEYPKPIIAYIENICTAGAYQIAAATDHIIATGSAIIGNIGIQMTPLFNVNDLLKNLHINYQEIATGSYTTALSPCNTMTEEQRIMLQSVSDNTYQQLTKEIASKRHVQLHKIDQWGQGKIFTGLQAYDLKLIDAIGSKTTAINLLKKHIIPSDRKIEWITTQDTSALNFFWKCYNKEEDDIEFNHTSFFDSFCAIIFKHIRNQ